MANVDNAVGFSPDGHMTGGEIRVIPMTTAGTVYKGDAVTAGTGGTITASTAGIGATVVGVASQYALTGNVIGVWADPDIIFKVQCSTAIAATDVFVTSDHIAGGGDSNTYLSGHYIDLDSGGQFQVIGLVDAPGNAWGANADVRGIFAEHAFNTRGTI